MNTAGPSPLERQALARLKAGDAVGAESDFAAALNAASTPAARARIWEGLAEARFAQGLAMEGAIALEHAGSDTKPHLALRRALMLIQAGKFPLALESLSRLPVSARQGFDFWSLSADALRRTGRWSEAADAAGRGLKANPASRNLALIRAALGALQPRG